MVGFLKLLLTLGLISFFSYTFYVEPTASDDPAGAISRSAGRLATICERNKAECEFLGDMGNGIGYAAGIGWKLATGQGRLVYVPYDARSYASDTTGHSIGAANASDSSSGNAGRLTTLFDDRGSGNSDTDRSRAYVTPHRIERPHDSTHYGKSDGRSLGELIRSTNLFGQSQSNRDVGCQDAGRSHMSNDGSYQNRSCN